jgi:hypothetical protein
MAYHVFSIALDDDLTQYLISESIKRGITKSQLIRMILLKVAEKSKKGEFEI